MMWGMVNAKLYSPNPTHPCVAGEVVVTGGVTEEGVAGGVVVTGGVRFGWWCY